MIQTVGALRVLRQDVENDVILVETFVDVGDLALAEGVGERVVDILQRNTEARGGVAIDDKSALQAADLLIGVCVVDAGNFFYGFE